MDMPTFTKRWGSLDRPAQECRETFSVPGAIDIGRVSAFLSSSMHLAVIYVRPPSNLRICLCRVSPANAPLLPPPVQSAATAVAAAGIFHCTLRSAGADGAPPQTKKIPFGCLVRLEINIQVRDTSNTFELVAQAAADFFLLHAHCSPPLLLIHRLRRSVSQCAQTVAKLALV